MRRKNNRKTFDPLKYTSMDIFKKKIFIPLSVEAIAWEILVPAKWDPGSTNEGSRLAGMNLFTCNRRMSFMKSL